MPKIFVRKIQCNRLLLKQKISISLTGASVVGRLSSWLSTIWISLQAVVAVVYIGELIFRPVPFSQCASKVRLEADVAYVSENKK